MEQDVVESNVKSLRSSFPTKFLLNEAAKLSNVSKPSPSPSSVTEILRQYINFGYFFYFFPYKYKYDPSTSTFIIETSRTRKIISAVVQILVLYKLTTYFRVVHTLFVNSIYPDGTTSMYVMGGHAACAIFGFGYKATFLSTFWKRKQDFMDLFNEINKLSPAAAGESSGGRGSDNEIKRNLSDWIKFYSFMLCFVFLGMAIMGTIVGHGMIELSEWSLQLYLTKFADFTRFMFYMPSADYSGGFQYADYILACFQFLLTSWSELDSFFSDFITLEFVLTFKLLVYHFIQEITDPYCTQTQMLSSYTKLKRIEDKLNKLCGPILLGCLLEEILYYIVDINRILGSSSSWTEILRYVFFLAALFTALGIAAQATHQITSHVEDWLANRMENHYNEMTTGTGFKLTLLINELNKYRVGI